MTSLCDEMTTIPDDAIATGAQALFALDTPERDLKDLPLRTRQQYQRDAAVVLNAAMPVVLEEMAMIIDREAETRRCKATTIYEVGIVEGMRRSRDLLQGAQPLPPHEWKAEARDLSEIYAESFPGAHVIPLKAATLMEVWQPGDGDEDWTWKDEAEAIDWEELVPTLQKDGQLFPATLNCRLGDFRVLDGHHRILACHHLGIPVHARLIDLESTLP